MKTAYDEVPYPGQPFTQTHPDRLATLATLHGMTPPAVETARVLELGCGDGANLIPMALELPAGSFTGIDLSAAAIAIAQAVVSALGLRNISVRQMDLTEIGADFGQFDYIICHGLYSWVPLPVREKILDIFRVNMAPGGIAFISYNTYPGGHLRDILREMSLFHTRNISDPKERIQKALDLIRFLGSAYPESDLYGRFLKVEIDSFLRRPAEYFYHDEMADVSARPYFHEFIERARAHGLEYLSEAVLLTMQSGAYSPEVSETIRTLGADDPVLTEQYLDFLKLRSFRQTLLCHADATIDRTPRAERVRGLHVAAPSRPESAEPDIRSDKEERFQYPSGGSMATNHPLGKAALMHLGRTWPQAVAFSDLLAKARALTGRESESLEDDAQWLSDLVLKSYAAHFLELYVCPPKFRMTPGERPAASPLARLQAKDGATVTTLRHTSLKVDDERGRNLLQLLDGTRDRAALQRDLHVPAEEIESNLVKLGRLALLMP